MGFYGSVGHATEAVAGTSSINDALNWLSREATDLSHFADLLIGRLGPVTRQVEVKGSCEPRPAYACELAEQLAGQASFIASIRERIQRQLDTLELP